MSKVGEHYREKEEMGFIGGYQDYPERKSLIIDEKLEKHIRCYCGKLWGMNSHKRTCKRCKTKVMARGELGNKK